jgi:hypothetical protein
VAAIAAENERKYLELASRPTPMPAPESWLEGLKRTHDLIPLQPNLVHPFEGSVEDVHEEEYGVIVRGHAEDGENFRAMIAPYRNDPDTRPKRRIIGIDDVAAEVSYICFDGSAVRPHHGAWLSEKDRKVNFEVSGRHDLIVATLEGDCVYAIERETTGIHPNGVTNRTKLIGDLFKIRIRLIDTFGEVLDDFEMMLSLIREPTLNVELLSAQWWIRFRLRELVNEGHELVLSAYNIILQIQKDSIAAFQAGETDTAAIRQREKDAETRDETPLAHKAKEWETRVASFVGTHLSEAEKESFVKAKPSIENGLNHVKKSAFERISLSPSDETSRENKSYWTLLDSLKARSDRLDKILSNH